MTFIVLALFVVAAAAAAPVDDSGPVELIVNGVPEGQPIEFGDFLHIKLNEQVDGEVTVTNLLHPLTAEGIAEAAAAAVVETPIAVSLPAPAQPEVILPEAVVLPAPAQPEVVFLPEAVVLPAPAKPEVVALPEAAVLPAPAQPEVILPEAVILPAPAQPEVILPEAVVLPAPAQPEVVLPEAVVLPAPVAPEVISPAAQLPNGEIYNDGTVQVTINTHQEVGVYSTIQGWFSMVLNYFNNGAQTTQQII